MEWTKSLRDTEPFNQLPDDIFSEVARSTLGKKFPPHTFIFKQHDPPTGYLYLILDGLVEIVVLTPGGVEMVVDYRKEGTFFGATPIFTNETYTAGARSVKATDCYLIPQELLTRVARIYPHFSEHFTRAILSRVRNLYAEMVEDHGQKTLTQMEAYPFKKRLSEIMSSPVATCSVSTPAREIARLMTRRDIGALLVCDARRTAIGIVTKHDLVSKVLASELPDCLQLTATEIMTPQPFTMPPEAYMYEATAFMMSHKIKHLPIHDRSGPVGMVTLRDLMKYRSQKSMLLIGQIKEARTVEELAVAKSRVVRVAKALQGETRSHFETMEILSYIHHCILRRCFELVFDAMKQDGQSPPDIRFCLILMGSGGRKEMLLGPDQDNGLIYENFPDHRREEVDAFFVPFTERLVAAFAQIGYPLCHGKVMANNPLWRGRLQDWQARIASWVNAPEPNRVMYSTIFLDFMPLAGEPELCQELRECLHAEVRRKPIFLYHLLENDLGLKAPLGLLGRFNLEKGDEHKGQISLKEAGSILIVDCVRIFLLEQGVAATSTAERLDELVKLNVFNQETAEHLKAALEAFTFLRLRNEIALIDQDRPLTHYIDPYSLKRNEQDLLKEAFRAAGKLQEAAKRHFSVG